MLTGTFQNAKAKQYSIFRHPSLTAHPGGGTTRPGVPDPGRRSVTRQTTVNANFEFGKTGSQKCTTCSKLDA